MYVYASTPENIFSDTGLVLCELREFVPPLVGHDHYVIDSMGEGELGIFSILSQLAKN